MIHVEVALVTPRGIERAAGWLTMHQGQVWVWLDGAAAWAVIAVELKR